MGSRRSLRLLVAVDLVSSDFCRTNAVNVTGCAFSCHWVVLIPPEKTIKDVQFYCALKETNFVV